MKFKEMRLPIKLLNQQRERLYSPLSRQSAIRSGRLENANPVDPVLSHYISQERQPAAVPEQPNDQLHQSPKQVMLKIKLNKLKRRSSLKNRHASKQEGAPKSRSTTYESSVRNIFSTCKTSTMSSQTSVWPSTGFGMQLCEP